MIDADVIKARRDHLLATARCRHCRMTRAECDAQASNDPLVCCPDHVHEISAKDMDALLVEVASGSVRTVKEVDPPPIQGPQKASMGWLLDQGEWWQPKHGPMIKIHGMTDTHRLHTVRMLLRQATPIAFYEHQRLSVWLSHPLGPSGDMARDAFERELDSILANPIGWLSATPLLRSLSAALPRTSKTKAWAKLEQRAEHWSECPKNRNLDDPCRCRVEYPDDPEVGPPLDRALFDEASGQGVL